MSNLELQGKTTKKLWTKDLCAQAAAQYRTRSSFKYALQGGYKAARLNKWLDEICSHMVSPQMPRGHWQKFENVLAVAQEAKTFFDFKKVKGAYASAISNKWLDDLGLIESRRRPGYWTRERILKIARNYDTQLDFIKENSEAYQAATKKRIWAEIQLFLSPTKIYWSYDLCKTEAAKYKTRVAFHHECSGAYGYAHKKGFLDEICSHMQSAAASFGECAIEEYLLSHDLEFIPQKGFEGLPPKYRYDFYLPKFNLIIEHHGAQHETLGWGKTKAEKVIHLKGVQDRDKIKEDFAKTNNIQLIVIWQREYKGKAEIHALLEKHLNSQINGLRLNKRDLTDLEMDLIWREQTTFEDCQREAKKYQHRTDFKKHSNPIWKFSIENGFYDDITSHMTRPKAHNFKWTIEAAMNAAKSCESKVEFRRKFPGAVVVLEDGGLYSEACKHMLRPTTSTTAMTVIGDVLAVLVVQMSGYGANDYALRHHGGYLGSKAKGGDI